MLPIDDIRRLSRIQPGRAQLRAVVEWALVIAIVYVQHTQLPLFTLPLSLLLIASRQHAMLVLMHDAAHYRAAESRLANEIFGEALAWPMLISMRGYRRHHQKHHQQDALNTVDDPDFERKLRRAPENWRFPMPRARLVTLLLRDVLLLSTHEYVWEAKDAGNLKRREGGSVAYGVGRLAFFLALVTTVSLLGAWKIYLLYWVLPSFTFLKAILRIRSLADHFAVKDAAGAFARTRTIVAPLWERVLLAPAGIGIHGPHHAYASIPYYRLADAHAALMSSPAYREEAVVSRSYFRALTEELCP
jgi:fatty acid desaturase